MEEGAIEIPENNQQNQNNEVVVEIPEIVQQNQNEGGNVIANNIKNFYQRANCRSFVSALIYFSFVLVLAGGLFLTIFYRNTESHYTEPEKQCSGYSESDTKTYLNCYNENLQCKLNNCSVDQCLESKLSILRCVPSKFDSYDTTSSTNKILSAFGVVLISFSFTNSFIALYACLRYDRCFKAQDVFLLICTQKFPEP